MAIYKQVMPERNIDHQQVKQITDDHESDASVLEQNSEEVYEYFSDKEEAEKNRKKEKQKPKLL